MLSSLKTSMSLQGIILVFLTVLHGAYDVKVPEFITSPPTMIRQPPQEFLYKVATSSDEQDTPFELECEAIGRPEPEYRWMKNGLEFHYISHEKRIQQPRYGTLLFVKPEDVDEGLYQCFASNKYGTAVSNAVFLRKAELRSFKEVDPEVKVVKEGDPLTLHCNPPTGYPRPTIFWMIQTHYGSLKFINSSRITADSEGGLYFSNVTIDDDLHQDMYVCSATSTFRHEYKIGNRIILKVNRSGGFGQKSIQPIKQYVSPSYIVALRGDELELSCIFGGTPLPDVKWRKSGSLLYSSKYAFKNYGKTLRIRNVDFDDEGIYECEGSNGIGTRITHTITVTVDAIPEWTQSSENTVAAEGEAVEFICEARGNPEPKLQWLVNGEPLEKAQPNPRRKLEGNVLTIVDLTIADSAVYQCNASNAYGYAFKNFYLNVLDFPPLIMEGPSPLTEAVVTSVVTLTCKAFGAPKPDVHWFKEDKRLNSGRYQVMDNGDLQINNALISDQGTYTCSASNKFGDINAYGKLLIKGKTVINHPPESFEVAAGKPATFRCNAETDPSLNLKIYWLFNGRLIDFDEHGRIFRATENSFIIKKTFELDAGIYTCIAETELDKAEAKAILTVQDVPNPPRIISVNCDATFAFIVWQPMGDRRAPILSYSIQYNTSFDPETWVDATHTDIAAAHTGYKVILSPWGNYSFRVIAQNKIGLSEPSAPSQVCTTTEDVPYSNPAKVWGKGTNPQNLVISWTRLPLIEHNAPGLSYEVYWKQDGIPQAKWNHSRVRDWKQTKLVVRNQPTFTRYLIKVEAHNRIGQAKIPAEEVYGYSGEDVPTQAPQNLEIVTVIDATSAVLVWDPVDPLTLRGHFRGYKILAWTYGGIGRDLREVTVPRNVTEALVNILKPNTWNVVRICSYNDMYYGPLSLPVDFHTPEGTPGPVTYFEATPVGSSAFYLKWERPLQPNGEITGYRIYYREVDGTALGATIERVPILSPDKTEAMIAGLTPNTKYRIIIHATTKAGQGEPYYIEMKTNKPSENVPDVPNFMWSLLPDELYNASILVTLQPHVRGSYFYVQYRKKGEDHWDQTSPELHFSYIPIKGLEFDALYEIRVVTIDGELQRPSKIVEIQINRSAFAGPAPWIIFVICGIVFFSVLMVVVCWIARYRMYSVKDQEQKQHGIVNDGFEESYELLNVAVFRGSIASLLSIANETSDSTLGNQTADSIAVNATSASIATNETSDSVPESMEEEIEKFKEDGSFIAQYRRVFGTSV